MNKLITQFGLATVLAGAIAMPAAATGYLDYTSWQTAADAVSSDTRLIDFSGYTQGQPVEPQPLTHPAGASFREFADAPGLYPRVDNDSAFGGGWLVNRNHQGFDEFNNGYVIDFLEPVFAVSANDNPNEQNRLRVYDTSGTLIEELTNSTAQTFLGIVTSTQIGFATFINTTPNEDGIFAIDNLRFAVGETTTGASVPAPLGVTLLLCLIGGLILRRQR